MAKLSISTAWAETAAFVQRESRLLFPLAFMLISLPFALLGIVVPQPEPGQPLQVGPWLALVLVALLVSMIGNIAISYLALRPATSVGEAIGRGVRRLAALLGAGLLLMVAAMFVFLVAATIVVMLVPGATRVAGPSAVTPEMATATVLTMLVMLPVMLYFGARLMPMTPVAAAEDVNPLRIIGRAWALTAGHTLKLMGFILLVGLTVGILSFAVESVFGLALMALVGPMAPGSTGALILLVIMAAVNMVVTVYVTSLIARIYAQLAGPDSAGVFA